jgi:hypothetical protein
MSEDRKKPTAGFWITVALVAVLAGYPLSFGPACWVSSYLYCGPAVINLVYQPLMRMWWRGDFVYNDDLGMRYARHWSNKQIAWVISYEEPSGRYFWQGAGPPGETGTKMADRPVRSANLRGLR